ncbi:MAG: SWIM zinc finger family protein [Chloroflexota bacterium]
MSWYYDSKPTIKRDDGIKAKSKRGSFTKNWWANRWLTNMEKVMDKGRLQRGRRYARKGQVISLEEGSGALEARVQGSSRRPYKIRIGLKTLLDKEWDKVIEALAERPIFIAQLLAGEMPQEIEEAFDAANVNLYPTVTQLTQSCSCPDYADVCKHLAAVHYILAERFDEDPFLLFKLRGKGQDELMQLLNPYGETDQAGQADEIVWENPPLESEIGSFWETGDAANGLGLDFSGPDGETLPILDRLGPPDFLPNLGTWLNPAGRSMTQRGTALLFNTAQTKEEEEEEEEDKNA